jgi:hypothetical protein
VPLLPIFRRNPEEIYSLAIQQIVSLAGDGKLRDKTACCQELREYLSQARSDVLFRYADACIQGGFEYSGYVLQDLVNELGRRLDYKVENGLYQGRPNSSGYDGLWYAPDGHGIVVEVKTTDAYRINLDNLAEFRDELVKAEKISQKSSILVVVGRQDTGDLEAQVRGSKHAWDIRLISVDALLKCVKLKEETEEDTVGQIHALLVPFEYTRLDKIIDIAFTAARDAGTVIGQEALAGGAEEEINPQSSVGKQLHTPEDILDQLRQRITNSVAFREKAPLIRKSKALYWSADRTVRVVCSVSKLHPRGTYWYAYHPHWDRFLSEGQRGFYVLGCIGKGEAYALPFAWIHEKLDGLYVTERDEGKMYWHVYLEETSSGQMTFRDFKHGNRLPVEQFRVSLSKE